MATWKQLMISGSSTEAASVIVSGPSSSDTASLQIEGSSVQFNGLPTSDFDLPIGSLMKSSADQHVMVRISNDPVTISPYYIPWQAYAFDFNGDGGIGAADLLGFLIAYGTADGESGYTPNFDFNGDGEIGSADLLGFLVEYGEFLSLDDDNRPPIDFTDPVYDWANDAGTYVTPESVAARYGEFGPMHQFHSEFWLLGDLTAVYSYIENSNPPVYNASTFPYTYFDIFVYLYFTQTTGGIWGGSTFLNVGTDASPNNPFGYTM